METQEKTGSEQAIAAGEIFKTGEEALLQWVERYVANNNRGDSENYGSFWTNDVIWLPPGSPAIHGKEGIVEFARQGFANYRLKQDMTINEVRVIEDFGYIRVETAEEFIPVKDGFKAMSIRGKGIFMFRRQPDGTWLSTHCAWNFNHPQGYEW
jgi:uncharacterized protein (TIGR02246 family)